MGLIIHYLMEKGCVHHVLNLRCLGGPAWLPSLAWDTLGGAELKAFGGDARRRVAVQQLALPGGERKGKAVPNEIRFTLCSPRRAPAPKQEPLCLGSPGGVDMASVTRLQEPLPPPQGLTPLSHAKKRNGPTAPAILEERFRQQAEDNPATKMCRTTRHCHFSLPVTHTLNKSLYVSRALYKVIHRVVVVLAH